MSELTLEGARERSRLVDEFEAEVAAVAGVRNAADARLVEMVSRALDEGLWKGWRIHTPVQWLMWRAGLERSTAQRIVALARRAHELPVTMAALSQGRLSVDQAAKVARYTPAEFEESVCELAESATVAQIAAATRRYDFDASTRDRDQPEPTPDEPVPEPDPAAPDQHRDVSFGTDDDEWWLQARLPIDEGLEVEAALKASRDRLHRERRAAAKADAEANGKTVAVDENGPVVSVPQVSWADSLIGLARSAVATGAKGAEHSAAARLLVHLELGTPIPGTDGDDGGPSWVAKAHLGPALPDQLRRLLTCDGTAQIVVLVNGTPIETSAHQRIVPDRIRHLVEHRDGGCRVPGCGQTYWLQMHHITHWEDGGRTLVWNIVALCSAHHRMHHLGLLGITGNAAAPNGLTFTDHTGRVIEPAGKARPPAPADMPSVAPYQCPTGERLDKTCVIFSRCHRQAQPSPPGSARAGPATHGSTGADPPRRRPNHRPHTGGNSHDDPDDPASPDAA